MAIRNIGKKIRSAAKKIERKTRQKQAKEYANIDQMIKVFCYGDSNTYGFDPVTGLRHDANTRWTGILQQMLGPDYQVVEQGCNGRTTVYPEPGARWKSGKYGLKLCLNTYKPVEIMVLMLGTNDLKDYYHATAQEIASGVEELIKITRKFMEEKVGQVPEILLVSPIEIGESIVEGPYSDHFKKDAITRSRQLARLYKIVAKRQGCHYLNAAEYASPSQEDGLHMMPQEHAKLAVAIYQAIMEMS